MLSRRRLMIGSLAVLATGAAAIGGLGIVVFGDRYGAFGAILRRNLPDVRIPDTEIRKFVDAYWPEFLARGRRRAVLWQATVKFDGLVPGGAEIATNVERDVLTQFLIGSNFFQLSDPKSEAIEFFNLPSACPNPFYRT